MKLFGVVFMKFERTTMAEDVSEEKTGDSTTLQFRPDNNESEITLVELILLFWKGKHIIAAVTTFVTILSVVYVLFIATEIFSSTSHFILKTGKSGTPGGLSQLAVLAGMPIGSSGGNVDPSDYLDIVIQDGNFMAVLFERKWFFNGDSLTLDEIFEVEPDTTVANWQHVHQMRKYNTIRNGNIITVRKDAKIGTLKLTTNTINPQLAYDLNKHTLDYISGFIRNTIQSQAKEKRVFIENRLLEVTRDLEQSEIALARHKERNIVTVSPHVSLETARLTRRVTINTELYIQLMKQLEAAKVEELDDMTLVQILKYPEVPYRRSKPERTKFVLAAFAGGLFIGCLTVLAKQQFKRLKNLKT
jgi:uncharacterized protein involved in exopolysaccharide biosynthesis